MPFLFQCFRLFFHKMIDISDEVMKRKLLIDGDGIGDDRRINLSLKAFVKWCQMEADDSPEDRSEPFVTCS